MRVGQHVGDAPCEWCGAPSTGSIPVEVGLAGSATFVYHCEGCQGRCRRFLAVCRGGQDSALAGTDWLPSEGRPDLVIRREGQSPLTVRDHRRLKVKALRELLPPVSEPRKRKVKAPATLTPAEQAQDLAQRRRKLKREGEALDREIAAFAVSGELPGARLARVLGVSRQRVSQIAAEAVAA